MSTVKINKLNVKLCFRDLLSPLLEGLLSTRANPSSLFHSRFSIAIPVSETFSLLSLAVITSSDQQHCSTPHFTLLCAINVVKVEVFFRSVLYLTRGKVCSPNYYSVLNKPCIVWVKISNSPSKYFNCFMSN